MTRCAAILLLMNALCVASAARPRDLGLTYLDLQHLATRKLANSSA